MKHTTLDLNGPIISFPTNPVGVATTSGGSITLTGIASVRFPSQTPLNPAIPTGTISYLWYENGVGPLSDNENIIGSATTTLTLLNLTSPASNQRSFYLTAEYIPSAYQTEPPITAETIRTTGNAINEPIISGLGTATVYPVIEIITQPTSQSAITNNNAIFTVDARLTDYYFGSETYQWYLNGQPASDGLSTRTSSSETVVTEIINDIIYDINTVTQTTVYTSNTNVTIPSTAYNISFKVAGGAGGNGGGENRRVSYDTPQYGELYIGVGGGGGLGSFTYTKPSGTRTLRLSIGKKGSDGRRGQWSTVSGGSGANTGGRGGGAGFDGLQGRTGYGGSGGGGGGSTIISDITSTEVNLVIAAGGGGGGGEFYRAYREPFTTNVSKRTLNGRAATFPTSINVSHTDDGKFGATTTPFSGNNGSNGSSSYPPNFSGYYGGGGGGGGGGAGLNPAPSNYFAGGWGGFYGRNSNLTLGTTYSQSAGGSGGGNIYRSDFLTLQNYALNSGDGYVEITYTYDSVTERVVTGSVTSLVTDTSVETTTILGSRTPSLTLRSDAVGIQTVQCQISNPFASTVFSDLLYFTVSSPETQSNITVEAIGITNIATVSNIILANGELTLEPTVSSGENQVVTNYYSLFSPNRDLIVEADLYGGKGYDSGGNFGGEGGFSRIRFTMVRNNEYVISGLSTDINAPFIYRKGQLIACVGAGGHAGLEENGGAGGGIGIGGESGFGANGGSGGQVVSTGSLSLTGVFGSLANINPISPDTLAQIPLGGRTIKCTKGDYWRRQGISPCTGMENTKFLLPDGTTVINTAEISRGYKAGYEIIQTGGASIGGGGNGGAGATGGAGGDNNSGGGGGSGYTDGSVTVISSSLGGGTETSKVIIRLIS